MNRIPLTSDLPIQTRRARRIDRDTEQVLRAACHDDDRIQACYLLDARKQGSDEKFLIVAITADDEDFESIVENFDAAFSKSSIHPSSAYIMSSAGLDTCSADSRFYQKPAEQVAEPDL